MDLSGSVSASFTLLPTEIKCEILKQIPDLKTLLALIGASPGYFRVYSTSKAIILSEIARNAITPALLPVAVDAHAFREEDKGEKNYHHIERDPAAVRAYMTETLFQQKPRHLGTLSPEISLGLLQFHDTVEFFISDYAANRLALIKETLPSSDSNSMNLQPPIKLSEVEHFRLARAFYYLELFAQLFLAPSGSLQMNDPLSGQATSFLEHLRDFELEELLCVKSYLTDKLIVYLNQMEDEFVQEYMRQELYKVEPNDATCRWELDDWFFSMDGRHDILYWLEDVLTSGLGPLKLMVSADTMDDRFYNLRDTFVPVGIWSSALRGVPTYTGPPTGPQYDNPLTQGKFSDDVNKGNLAWFCLMRIGGHPRRSPSYANSIGGPRRWGYAIWGGKQRLVSFGLPAKR